MKILVTGHNGYIGSLLIPMLTAHGYQVQGIDSNLYESSLFGQAPVPVPSLHKDIRDVTAGDVAGCDAVIHLAGLSNDPLGDLDPQLTMEINYLATVRLAELAKKAGVKYFLFASSCSIYGASGPDMIDENSPMNPVTPYAHSKILAEQRLSKMGDNHFSPIFFRCATAHGYSPRIRFDLVVNNLVAWAYTTGKVLIKSDGSPWRPFVHIADICRAFIAVLNVPVALVHNQVFNVGDTAENYQIRQVAESVSQIVPNCEVEYAPDAGPDKRCYKVSSEKIAAIVPSFVPEWTVDRSIRDLLNFYTSLGLKQGEFEGPKYNRIAHLRELMRSGQLDKNLRWIK
ncbi:MAG: SDR family oxidoreductase [Proteobacteria bacterium]|nr:SDR family oxidoreductase [Pseudomonadota bacterium]